MLFYKVVSRYYNDGKTSAYMQKVEFSARPENKETSTPLCDEYIEYFTNKREAEKVVTECRNA